MCSKTQTRHVCDLLTEAKYAKEHMTDHHANGYNTGFLTMVTCCDP